MIYKHLKAQLGALWGRRLWIVLSVQWITWFLLFFFIKGPLFMLLTFALDSMWMSQPKRRSSALHFSFALVSSYVRDQWVKVQSFKSVNKSPCPPRLSVSHWLSVLKVHWVSSKQFPSGELRCVLPDTGLWARSSELSASPVRSALKTRTAHTSIGKHAWAVLMSSVWPRSSLIGRALSSFLEYKILYCLWTWLLCLSVPV